MGKILCITIPGALAIAVIAWAISMSSIEEAKQEAFMMKVCVDAGGSWLKSWNKVPSCAKDQPR